MKSTVSVSLLAVSLLLATQASADPGDRDGERYQRHYDQRYDYDQRHDSRYDDRDDGPYHDRYQDRYQDRYAYRDDRGRHYGNVGYELARVVRIERLGGQGRDFGRYCGDYGRHDGRYRDGRSGLNDGAVAGALIGGVIGNQVGRGDDRVAATVAGVAIGGLIGQSIDRDQHGAYDRQYVQCRADWRGGRAGDADYRVTYRYRGRLYTTLMPYYPGDSVRVRLDARPAYERVAYRY